MSDNVNSGKVPFSVRNVTRFYIPNMLQALSQTITYPLVAGIVTQGELGVRGLTAFSQGQIIMFLIGALGGGLVMTGMVFARTWYGYVSFKRLNAVMMSVLLALQCVPVISPFNEWIFEGLLALPPEMAEAARWTLLGSVVMNGAFFLRNVPMVILFNNYESGKANNATFLRIAVTLALAKVFPIIGLKGVYWGLLALTIGVVVELVMTWFYARPFVERLPNRPKADEKGPSFRYVSKMAWAQFRFTLPLSLGGFLLMLSPLVIAAFIGRTANAADMMAIHYVTVGVLNPVSFAAVRMQTVAIQFRPEYDGDRRLLVYALVAGCALGLAPLLFATPWVGDWYFGVYQNLPSHLLGAAKTAVGLYSLICLIQAVRGRIEGIAATQKRPKAVMAGQIGYTVGIVTFCAALTPLGVAGWQIAVAAIFAGCLLAVAAEYAVMAFYSRKAS